MKNKTFLLVLFAAFSMAVSAQITGTVLEEATDFPVIGASVLEVGTTNGVITDFDGNFVLNVKEGAKIQISYVGFATQTLTAKNGMIVKLAEDALVLQEVVAIGYGSQTKKEITGSVSSVKAEDFNKGTKSLREGAVDAYDTVMFRLSYDSRIDRWCLIKFRGRWFQIQSFNEDYQTNNIQITAIEMANQQVTIIDVSSSEFGNGSQTGEI